MGDLDTNDAVMEEIKTEAGDVKQTECEKAEKGKPSIIRSSKLRQKDDLAYISDFMSYIHIPNHKRMDEDEDEDQTTEMTDEVRERLHLNRNPENRATSKEELQERLNKNLWKLELMPGRNLRTLQRTSKQWVQK